MKLVKHFKDITGFESYSFQIELAEKILRGSNVIMQAPTGSGKTWASILPYLIARKENINFPNKLIYVLPLRALANSLYTDIKNNKFIKENNIKVTIQTGEHNEDPYFLDGDIIFTTIDQVLSSVLCIPFSLSKRQWNINAGAILTSYLVFDEFHLLEPKRALATTFILLRKFKGKIPFCLMTATLSNKLLDLMCKELNADRVSIDDSKLGEIKSQKNKKRYIEVLQHPITSDDVINNHKRLSIVICNTVQRCQKLYLEIKKKIRSNEKFRDTKIICINSRFISEDRKRIEQLIKNTFKKGSMENAILISTQIIEVGIDISCDTMHTEISPISSFLQRIGRCARYEGEEGRIFIYDVLKENKKQSYLPYNEGLCKKTLAALRKMSKTNLDFLKSQKLIDEILTDKEINELIAIVEGDFEKKIKRCWINPQKNYASRLIREINAISVIVCSNPEKIKSPYLVDKVSIYRFSLKSQLSKIEKEFEEDWIVKVPEEDNFLFDLSDEKAFTYKTIGKDDKSLDYEPLIILNSKYVSYSTEIGLNFDGIGQEKIVITESKNDELNSKMRKETYKEHIENMLLAYKDLFSKKFNYTFNKISTEIDFEELINFMIILHDYGKLSFSWQEFARNWQKKLGDDCTNQLLAHTDEMGTKEIYKRPPKHSGAGAIVSDSLLKSILPDKIRISVMTSILRHHGVTVKESSSYKIKPEGKKEVLNLLKLYSKNFSSKINTDDEFLLENDYEDLSTDICDFGNSVTTMLYFILVRILRICDQKSFNYHL